MIDFFQVLGNDEYVKFLSIMASLSRLFSQSNKPFIYYRFAENIFCKCFNATNLSRSDTAFDAKFGDIGVGLKTFVYENDASLEKVAEFNALSSQFLGLSDVDLADKLAKFRNERINLAKCTYDISQGVYHIVARTTGKIVLFESDYDEIDRANLREISPTRGGIKFNDGTHEYVFNRSKSTLLRKFNIPPNAREYSTQIIDDFYELLRLLQGIAPSHNWALKAGVDYVILPLYGFKNGEKAVFERSGLNQFNAAGRKRDPNEVHIPVPSKVRDCGFFPPRDEPFSIKVPTGEILNAKICQQGEKALMTNPNKAIADWLLRKILHLNEGELATYERLKILGFDSAMVGKDDKKFSIDIASCGAYERFLNQIKP